MNYSERHEAMYADMVAEMLQFAGFQESVNSILRGIAERLWPSEAQWVDDLYEIYSGLSVIDDED